MRNPISAKVDFGNASLAKCLFLQSQTPKFKPKIIRKSNLEIDMKKNLCWSKSTQKALKMGPLNQQQIDEIQAWTS